MPHSPPPTSLPLASSSSLVLLPPSPAASTHSSLSYEEASFDQNNTHPNDDAAAQRPILGLRDILSMHSQDLARKAGLSTTRARSPRGGIRVNTATYIGDEERRVFGKQVVIGGWKVVGGKSWTDVGKLGAYVVYDIDIELVDGGSINILRRYSHFESLRSALVRRYPYLQSAIPLLPGKLHMTKFSPKFLEDRQIRLQRFLKAVVLHPDMGRGGPDSVVGAWIIGDGSLS
ncbi:hypothetical protein B9479_004368 [Cryptococcus floricola]|uniref:PX domain-containing protein n=1 Tax=Cryptococcus floricola TaxID=2591691 RepID=A0A5D3AYN4_9TREE|nr:hypothetical protein B9479_004368 [Cryptococcus floricola]